MTRLTKLSIAALCLLGASTVGAQTVQRDGKVVTPAQTRAPVQSAQAQAPASGGAATGGAAGGTAATAGGISLGTAAFIAVGVVAVAAAASSGSDDPPVTHNP